ncbi:MAG: hypothetical protein MR430_10425 [Lachnospiraceae bacterium]|nr:hypothetical protein [Lachnospiraceae bacterium]
MKYMNMLKKYRSIDLQIFADSAGDEGTDGNETGEGDDPEDDESGEDDEDEKKFSQKDIDEAIKKRIARERRKWQREQQKNTGKKDEPDDSGKKENKEDAEKQEAINKAASLEVKVACYEAGVAKDAVEDVAAIARAYMESDHDLDLEDAIEKVVEKYPSFKKGSEDPYEDGKKTGNWGERHSGSGTRKMSGVEAKFYALNPDLK